MEEKLKELEAYIVDRMDDKDHWKASQMEQAIDNVETLCNVRKIISEINKK